MTKDWRKIREVLAEIGADAERDAKAFDGRPFNGRTVAEYFGNHGAAIQALARAIDALVEVEQEKQARTVAPIPFAAVSDGK